MTVYGLISISLGLLFTSAGMLAQSPAEEFEQSCAMCHTIGDGALAGPDLAGMSDRRERSWLVRFILDPQAVIDSGDATARAVLQQYQGMVMPPTAGMTPERAAALVDYVRQQERGEGAVEKQAAKPPPEPFTPQDVARGRELFSGVVPLAGGGTACLACHQAGGLSGLGGGSLGPSLTQVYIRLGGRQGLESWLASPPTRAMASLYGRRPLTEQEIKSLIAYLEESASSEAKPAVRTGFLLLGLGGTVVLLFCFHLLWRERFQGVRRKLVIEHRLRGAQ